MRRSPQMASSGGGHYKIGSLSRQTGFSPALLRAWERRFGLLAPERGQGRQRWYDDDDLRVLAEVRRQLDAGRPIGEIARRGREALLAIQSDVTGQPAAAGGPGRATPALDAWRRRLVAAALALDTQAMALALDEVFAGLSAERAIQDVLEPVADDIGRLWAEGRCSVASEHFMSHRFAQRVRALLDAAEPARQNAPVVLAACFPEEQHELGLLVVSWHIARQDARVSYLGAALPLEDVARACRAARPKAVLLSVSRPATFDRYAPALRRLATEIRGTTLFVGGRGVPTSAGRARSGAVFFPFGTPLQDVVAGVSAVLGRARSRRRTT